MMSGVAYAWSLMGMITIIKGYVPPEFQTYVKHWAKQLYVKLCKPDPYCRFYFHEIDSRRRSNHLYRQVEMHLRAKHLFKDADDLCLTQDENAKKISYTLAGDETVSERYEGIKVWWTFSTEKSKGQNGREREENKYELKMLKTDKAFVMAHYMDYVVRSAKEYKSQLRDLYLYSCNHERWKSHTFQHPSTFETLAMDPGTKERLMADLTAYAKGEAYFKKVGRAWKRGYLLYGPPGTGKSSLIAAMANRLRYNIYDLELTEVYDNSQLKSLLTNTTSKSIIVIEDIDCSLDLAGSRVPKHHDKTKGSSTKWQGSTKKANNNNNNNNNNNSNNNNRTSKVTLSGLLNFTDGLWSCLGNERIIIFTTNHIEKLDPGLLRPGRMDLHIHMSFCNYAIFKALAENYMSVTTHPLFEKVEELLLEDRVNITPAEVTEFLFQHKDNHQLALETLVEDLVRRTVEREHVDNKESVFEEEEEAEATENEELATAMGAASDAIQNGADDEDCDAKPCTRIHCNVASHVGQVDWFKIYVDFKQKVVRQGGIGGGKRLQARSRFGRY